MGRVADDQVPSGAPEPIEDRIDEIVRDDSPWRASLHNMLQDISRVDHAVYGAVASTTTPALDAPMRRLSNSANGSLIWLAIAGGLAVAGGVRGRRAALAGLTSIAVSSAVVNVALKRLYPRERPDRATAGVIFSRQTRMPESASFPSGHSASGFAFATAVGHQIPLLSFPLRVLAAAVAYSRVHSGVHYPGDTIVGSLTGAVVGLMVSARFNRRGTANP
jgi:membrane-associated phospholipid phosphatase